MGEFLSNYGYLILIALFVVGCYLLHGFGGHGGHTRQKQEEDEARQKSPGQSNAGGHEHP